VVIIWAVPVAKNIGKSVNTNRKMMILPFFKSFCNRANVNYFVQIDINTASRRQYDGRGLFVAKRDWRVSGCFHKVNKRLSKLCINRINLYPDKKEKKIFLIYKEI